MANLYTYGMPHSRIAFGAVGDTVSAGRPAGGVHINPTEPATPREAELGVRLDPKGAMHPRTSPVFWLVAMLVAFGYLNYRARR